MDERDERQSQIGLLPFVEAVARQFIAQGQGGKIVNIADAVFQGGMCAFSHLASKSGIKGITMLMANEWAKYGVNVNAIAPGYTQRPTTPHSCVPTKRATLKFSGAFHHRPLGPGIWAVRWFSCHRPPRTTLMAIPSPSTAVGWHVEALKLMGGVR